MSTRTKHILTALKVLAWIIFIGLCIKTGAMIISFVVSLFNPVAASDLYLGMDLSTVYEYGKWEYMAIVSLQIAGEGLKAYMFYLVTLLLSGINLEQPFSRAVGGLLTKISRTALEIGIIALILNSYADWLLKRGLIFSYEAGSTEFLFLAGIVFVIAQIFKRGLELQTENELTV